MFYKTLKGLDFRAKKYKKDEFVELDIGLANKLILDGVVDKCDQDEAKTAIAEAKKDKKTPKELLIEEATALEIDVTDLTIAQLETAIAEAKKD